MGGVPTESGGPSVQLYLLILLRLKDRDCQKKRQSPSLIFSTTPKVWRWLNSNDSGSVVGSAGSQCQVEHSPGWVVAAGGAIEMRSGDRGLP